MLVSQHMQAVTDYQSHLSPPGTGLVIGSPLHLALFSVPVNTPPAVLCAAQPGLFGLLAAHRNQPQQQPAQPQQQLPTQPQQLPQHMLPPHLLQQPQYAPPPQQQQHVGHMMPPPQQLSGPPPPAVQAAMQPLPASGNSSTPVASALAAAAAAGPGAGVPAAAAPRSKGPPPGFKAPPPGFGNPGIASAAAMAAAPQQQQQAPLQQQQGSVAQADNRAAGSVLLAALHNSSTSAQQGTLAVAAGGAVGTARAGRLPPHLQHMQAGAGAPQQPPAAAQAPAAAAAQAPAGPSPAPPAAPQQQQAPTSTIPSASSSSSQPQSSQPPPQQQQQQQQPLPRPSLQEWQARLREEMAASSDGGPSPCNLKEGLKWLAGFAPEAWDVLDEPFEKYFHYIRDTHGTNVLTCVVFFSLGHHDVYRGGQGGGSGLGFLAMFTQGPSGVGWCVAQLLAFVDSMVELLRLGMCWLSRLRSILTTYGAQMAPTCSHAWCSFHWGTMTTTEVCGAGHVLRLRFGVHARHQQVAEDRREAAVVCTVASPLSTVTSLLSIFTTRPRQLLQDQHAHCQPPVRQKNVAQQMPHTCELIYGHCMM